MSDAISNTSPLLYLYRIGTLNWLPRLFGEIWTPVEVVRELQEGRQRGFDVPNLAGYGWLQIVAPHSIPSEWLALDLGPGELAVLALTLENPNRIALLDDRLARRIAQAAGLTVWGTLKIFLEAKAEGLIDSLAPLIDKLVGAGMWLSDDLRQRVLALAGEKQDRPM